MAGLFSLVDYNNRDSLGSRLRLKRFKKILELIDSIYSKKGAIHIVDLGGTAIYWAIIGHDYLLSKYPKMNITLVNSDPKALEHNESPLFSVLREDVCDLLNPDNSFDLVHSNSTIEHLESWNKIKTFSQQIRRLAPVYYVQPPYFWFPIEPHFLAPFYHWLPECWRAKIITKISLGHVKRVSDIGAAMDTLTYFNLLDKTQISFLFPDAKIEFERFIGFPKSLIVVRS